ncbi:histidine phosphatase family protein [candidate division KSB1 bacterium]|nr:histidine phosphatase family protein [candidate division KSB1 bacterium]
MKKRLYIVRHAKSSWDNPDLDDFDRPLNERGKKDATFMGKKLAEQHVHPDIIVSSPAKRAIKTAKLLGKQLDYPQKAIKKVKEIYEAGTQTLVKVLKQIDDSYHKVLLIGHNPGLSDLANYLCGHPVENIPTTGIYIVDFDIDSWQDISQNGTFAGFEYPKKYS